MVASSCQALSGAEDSEDTLGGGRVWHLGDLDGARVRMQENIVVLNVDRQLPPGDLLDQVGIHQVRQVDDQYGRIQEHEQATPDDDVIEVGATGVPSLLDGAKDPADGGVLGVVIANGPFVPVEHTRVANLLSATTRHVRRVSDALRHGRDGVQDARQRLRHQADRPVCNP